MPNINELNRRRQSRIAEIEAMPDDDPVEADKMIPDENKESIINSLRRIKKLLKDGLRNSSKTERSQNEITRNHSSA